ALRRVPRQRPERERHGRSSADADARILEARLLVQRYRALAASRTIDRRRTAPMYSAIRFEVLPDQATQSVDEGSEDTEDAAARRIPLLALRDLQPRDGSARLGLDDLPQRHPEGRRRDRVHLAEAESPARSRQVPDLAHSVHAHAQREPGLFNG